eukprot:10462023-Lingulodinium_polyedra.AAC.1
MASIASVSPQLNFQTPMSEFLVLSGVPRIPKTRGVAAGIAGKSEYRTAQQCSRGGAALQ